MHEEKRELGTVILARVVELKADYKQQVEEINKVSKRITDLGHAQEHMIHRVIGLETAIEELERCLVLADKPAEVCH